MSVGYVRDGIREALKDPLIQLMLQNAITGGVAGGLKSFFLQQADDLQKTFPRIQDLLASVLNNLETAAKEWLASKLQSNASAPIQGKVVPQCKDCQHAVEGTCNGVVSNDPNRSCGFVAWREHFLPKETVPKETFPFAQCKDCPHNRIYGEQTRYCDFDGVLRVSPSYCPNTARVYWCPKCKTHPMPEMVSQLKCPICGTSVKIEKEAPVKVPKVAPDTPPKTDPKEENKNQIPPEERCKYPGCPNRRDSIGAAGLILFCGDHHVLFMQACPQVNRDFHPAETPPSEATYARYRHHYRTLAAEWLVGISVVPLPENPKEEDF